MQKLHGKVYTFIMCVYIFSCHRLPEGSEPQDPPPVMVIGNNNVFEVDSYCQASKVGDNNILEAKSKVPYLLFWTLKVCYLVLIIFTYKSNDDYTKQRFQLL